MKNIDLEKFSDPGRATTFQSGFSPRFSQAGTEHVQPDPSSEVQGPRLVSRFRLSSFVPCVLQNKHE